MEQKIWKKLLLKYKWVTILSLFSVLTSSNANASSCKVDLGIKTEAFESENCIDKVNFWVVQSCGTKKFCKVSDKFLVKAHNFKCPKNTGTPKLICYSVPKIKFNSSAFIIAKDDDLVNINSGSVFYDLSNNSILKNKMAIATSEGIDDKKIVAFRNSEFDTVSVCATNIETLNTKYLQLQSENFFDECKF